MGTVRWRKEFGHIDVKVGESPGSGEWLHGQWHMRQVAGARMIEFSCEKECEVPTENPPEEQCPVDHCTGVLSRQVLAR